MKAVCYELSPALHIAATKFIGYVSASPSAKFLLAALPRKVSFHHPDRLMRSHGEKCFDYVSLLPLFQSMKHSVFVGQAGRCRMYYYLKSIRHHYTLRYYQFAIPNVRMSELPQKDACHWHIGQQVLRQRMK